ncbi:hypothetical protein QQP08_025131 [Theobroma cacao]|nr:hypothetical protein QQP08_025131 [Theobroma cacao]
MDAQAVLTNVHVGHFSLSEFECFLMLLHKPIHQIGIGSEASFGFVNADQQVAGRFSAPTTPQPFSSVGGNPFG